MRQALIRSFAVVSYLAFLASFSSFAAFVCGLIPARDGGPGGALAAVAVDLGLVTLFGVTHSVMARQTFKRLLTESPERPAHRRLRAAPTSSSSPGRRTGRWRTSPPLWGASSESH